MDGQRGSDIDLTGLEPPMDQGGHDAGPPPSDDRFDGPPRNGRGRGRQFDRVPPHSLEAEVSVLGSAMLSQHAANTVTELLDADDFYRSAHAVVFEAVTALTASGTAVDTISVLEWVRDRHRLDEIGGAAAVTDLVAATPTSANAEYYANVVREKALLRRLIEAGTNVVQMGYQDTEDPLATVGRAENEVLKVSDIGSKSEYAALSELLVPAFKRLEKLSQDNSEVTGLPTGFDDLDRLTAGLQPENLIIIAARPAMGKCLTGDTKVPLADGRVLRLDELVEHGRAGKPIEVLALDEHGTLGAVAPTEFHDNGVREVHHLQTRFGRAVRATANHPFLTPDGWKQLDELEPGDLIATPRGLPSEGRDRWANAEVDLLAYLLGDGSLTGTSPVLTTASEEILQEAVSDAQAFGCEAVVDGRVAMSDETHGRIRAVMEELHHDGQHAPNHLTKWLQELGVWGLGSHDKHVPDAVFRLCDQQIARFLSRLYATDGSAWVAEGHGCFGVSYTSVSERLARDVQHLLLRLGVVARLRHRRVLHAPPDGEPTRGTAFEVEVRDARNVLRFLDRIGIFSKEEACTRVRLAAASRRPHSNLDLLPMQVWDEVLQEKGQRSWADISEAAGRSRSHNWHAHSRRPSRRIVGELAAAMGSEHLAQRASEDVLWDEVTSIDEAGRERVYDVTVPGLHNFVANDLVVHNSSFALNLAQYVTVSLKKPTIVFSLEMSKIEIVNRMLSAEAGIASDRIKTGRFDDRDWRRLSDALGRLSEAPLFIDDTPSISMLEIAAKCRRLKQKSGLELVVIDYLQLMQSHRSVDNRQQEVAEISRGLKMLAKDLGVPVIALSQLSRQPESRVDKRPMLADLRESGSIEQDADIVGFIYRDEVYDEHSPDKGIAELIISKHRNGQVATVRLAFLGHLTKFANLASKQRGPGDSQGPPQAPPPDSPL